MADRSTIADAMSKLAHHLDCLEPAAADRLDWYAQLRGPSDDGVRAAVADLIGRGQAEGEDELAESLVGITSAGAGIGTCPGWLVLLAQDHARRIANDQGSPRIREARAAVDHAREARGD